MAGIEAKPEKGLKFVEGKFGEGDSTVENSLRQIQGALMTLDLAAKFAQTHKEPEESRDRILNDVAVRNNLEAMADEIRRSINLHTGWFGEKLKG